MNEELSQTYNQLQQAMENGSEQEIKIFLKIYLNQVRSVMKNEYEMAEKECQKRFEKCFNYILESLFLVNVRSLKLDESMVIELAICHIELLDQLKRKPRVSPSPMLGYWYKQGCFDSDLNYFNKLVSQMQFFKIDKQDSEICYNYLNDITA
jgi:hypothetical protein